MIVARWMYKTKGGAAPALWAKSSVYPLELLLPPEPHQQGRSTQIGQPRNPWLPNADRLDGAVSHTQVMGCEHGIRSARIRIARLKRGALTGDKSLGVNFALSVPTSGSLSRFFALEQILQQERAERDLPAPK